MPRKKKHTETADCPKSDITKKRLLKEGFIYRAKELSQEFLQQHLTDEQIKLLSPRERDDFRDPFYFYKGNFRIYDVVKEFYLANGAKIFTMAQVRKCYEEYTGNPYQDHFVPADTDPVNVEYTGSAEGLSKGIQKISLRGGPGDGLTLLWPKVANFYIHQVLDEKGKSEIHRYVRKEGARSVYDYHGYAQ